MHVERSRPAPRHQAIAGHPIPETSHEGTLRASPPPPGMTRIPAVETAESLAMLSVPPPKSMAGFLLLDSSWEPISFNAEVVRILSYPDDVADLRSLDHFLTEKIRSRLISQEPAGESRFVTEFRSGRRRYFCRVLSMGSQFKDPSGWSIALLLERGPAALVPLSQVSQRFHLTRREREVLEQLLQGLTNKEIGERLHISPNTVKAFLRIIMNKMGVSSRSAVLPKIIMTHAR